MDLHWKVCNTKIIMLHIKQQITKELNGDIVGLFELTQIQYIVIKQLTNCYWTKIIIHLLKVVTKSLRTLTISRLFFIGIAEVYICIDLLNIRNIYVKYSHCWHIHFMVMEIKCFPARRNKNWISRIYQIYKNKRYELTHM